MRSSRGSTIGPFPSASRADRMRHMLKARLLSAAAVLVLAASSGTANAESIIRNPGDHPNYKVELEPHLDFGWANLYASNGFGAGVRVGIPIVHNGFISTINNSVAISL